MFFFDCRSHAPYTHPTALRAAAMGHSGRPSRQCGIVSAIFSWVARLIRSRGRTRFYWDRHYGNQTLL